MEPTNDKRSDYRRLMDDLNKVILGQDHLLVSSVFLSSVCDLNEKYGIGTVEKIYDSNIKRIFNVIIREHNGYMNSEAYTKMIDDEAKYLIEIILSMAKIMNQPETPLFKGRSNSTPS